MCVCVLCFMLNSFCIIITEVLCNSVKFDSTIISLHYVESYNDLFLLKFNEHTIAVLGVEKHNRLTMSANL